MQVHTATSPTSKTTLLKQPHLCLLGMGKKGKLGILWKTKMYIVGLLIESKG